MLSPSPGSTFSSSTVTFGWTAGNTNGYGLYIGNSVGSKDIYFSGLLSTLSVIVSNLPAESIAFCETSSLRGIGDNPSDYRKTPARLL